MFYPVSHSLVFFFLPSQFFLVDLLTQIQTQTPIQIEMPTPPRKKRSVFYDPVKQAIDLEIVKGAIQESGSGLDFSDFFLNFFDVK